MRTISSITPNYTLISESGVRIFTKPEEIIEIFSEQRREVVKRRYELLVLDYKERIKLNNEIIRFIKKKEYEVATKSKNRKSFVDYLAKKKFKYNDYLADMPIYRMTKDEVAKRQLLIKDDSSKLKEFEKIAKSVKLIQKKLIEELHEVSDQLTAWLKEKENQKKSLKKKMNKKAKKSKGH